MINQIKLLTYSVLSFVLFISLMGCNDNQTTTIKPKEELTTYTYVITSIDNEGYYGDSVTDDTGIFLTHDTVNINLEEGDKIEVSYPDDQFDVITKVTKIN
jgi:uncharacterized lipoprotein YehR (DUF1307 family)